ncbi:hypothetical protein OROGR_007309 [Orobanche gracilis]
MDHPSNVQYDSVKDEFEKVEPGDLLEESWFFGNLLGRRNSRMPRCFSDPCTSSSYSLECLPEKSYEETYESIKKKLSARDDEVSRGPKLIGAPSIPSNALERRDQKATTKEMDPQRGIRSNRKKTWSKSLIRNSSLPTSLEAEEFQDEEEVEFSMGKLIRQASMNYSDTLPPRTHSTAKGLTPSRVMSRYRSRRKPDLESIQMEGLDGRRPQRSVNQLITQRSLIDPDSEELQGFSDLGFDVDSSRNVNIITGSHEQNKIQEEEDEDDDDGGTSRTRKPYVSEAWGAQSHSAPPIPKWGGKGRSTADMKAQIKFWARVVASNVRQEC